MIRGNYHHSYKNYFWIWEEEEEVLAIPDGSTIAYRPMITEVLEQLAPQGLPSFGTILLAMVATNSSLDQPLEHIRQLIRQRFITIEKNHLASILDPAMNFLNILAAMPAQYKSKGNRILLLRTIFENAHNNKSLKESRAILAHFKEEKLRYHHAHPQKSANLSNFQRDFRPLALLLRQFPDTNAILEAMAKVPKLDKTIDLPPSPAKEHENELIQQLINESQTSAIGNLIPHIWAGLRIPQYRRLPDEDKMGGFSDISNKGNFDRLLISEFAYDDLTFLTRLANNETLFLQRESPPAANKESRVILIDHSLKSWGTPKLIAHAVALAIDQHHKNKRESEVFLVGEDYHPMSHDNIHAIIMSVCQLNGGIDAAKGIDLFFKDYPLSKNQEVFFLTNEKALEHPAMQKSMSDHRMKISYLLPIDQEGNCSIFSNGIQGKKFLQKLALGGKIKSTPAPQKQQTNIKFNIRQHPLLYPICNGKKIDLSKEAKQTLIISDKKGLFLFKGDGQKGLYMLCDKLPSNTQMFVPGYTKKNRHVLLCMGHSNRKAYLLDLKNGETLEIPYHGWLGGALKVVFMDKQFYAFNYGQTFCLEEKEKIRFVLRNDVSRSLLKEVWEEQNNKQGLFRLDAQIITKVKTVRLLNGELIINNHPLQLLPHGLQWRMMRIDNRAGALTAQKVNRNTFEFADGSQVKTSLHGMLKLVSSDKNIPAIHLPVELGSTLGVATHEEFAGNEHFLPENSFLKRIDMEVFYQKHIIPFVRQIIKND